MAFCKKCGLSYSGIVCPCFIERAAAEKYELNRTRFIAGEMSGRLFDTHVFVLMEDDFSLALCGHRREKRLPKDVLHVGLRDKGMVACAGCSGRMGSV